MSHQHDDNKVCLTCRAHNQFKDALLEFTKTEMDKMKGITPGQKLQVIGNVLRRFSSNLQKSINPQVEPPPTKTAE